MTAIIYQRVSTSYQTLNGLSLENQNKRLVDYCNAHGYVNIISISDEGFSGKITNRPGFQKLQNLIKTKTIDAVIVFSLSRFARNVMDTLQVIKLLEKYSVSFHSLTDNINTNTAIGRFFFTTLSALAQLEIEQTGERIKSVLQHKKNKMERVGQIPFGWFIDSDKKLKKDKSEQFTIRLIEKLRQNGFTYDAIAKELIRKKRKNKVGNFNWFKSQVYRIHKNQVNECK